MKSVIEFSIQSLPDNTFVLHYSVPNYSGSNKKITHGDVYTSSLSRAIERMEMIVEYLKNPIPGKELHQIMAETIIKQQARK